MLGITELAYAAKLVYIWYIIYFYNLSFISELYQFFQIFTQILLQNVLYIALIQAQVSCKMFLSVTPPTGAKERGQLQGHQLGAMYHITPFCSKHL